MNLKVKAFFARAPKAHNKKISLTSGGLFLCLFIIKAQKMLPHYCGSIYKRIIFALPSCP